MLVGNAGLLGGSALEQQVVETGVLEAPAAVREASSAKAVRRGVGSGGRFVAGRQQRSETLLDDGKGQLGLVLEVEVHRHRSDPDGSRHGPQGERRLFRGAEQTCRGLDDVPSQSQSLTPRIPNARQISNLRRRAQAAQRTLDSRQLTLVYL